MFNKAKKTAKAETFVSFPKHIVITETGEIFNFDGFRVYPITAEYFGRVKNVSSYSTTSTETAINKSVSESGLKKFDAAAFLQAELNCVVFPYDKNSDEFKNLLLLIESNEDFQILAAGFGR